MHATCVSDLSERKVAVRGKTRCLTPKNARFDDDATVMPLCDATIMTRLLCNSTRAVRDGEALAFQPRADRFQRGVGGVFAHECLFVQAE